jgi:amino acid permease
MDQATRVSIDDFSSDDSTVNRIHRPKAACPSPGSISNLCSATLGAGALSLPYAFSLTGLIPGVALLLLSGYLTILSIDVIISSCVKTKLYKYEDVAVRLAGRSAGRALEASLLIFCFGTAVAYIVAMGDILDMGVRSVMHVAGGEEGAGLTSIYSREKVMCLFWLLLLFPLSLQRNMEGLERFSSLGVMSIIFLVVAAVIHSIKHGEILGKTDSDAEETMVDIHTMLWPDSFWGIVQAFPIIIFAFSCQVNVCAIFEELHPGDGFGIQASTAIKEKMMRRITRSGITLCITLYIAIGTFGYLDFAHETVSAFS